MTLIGEENPVYQNTNLHALMIIKPEFCLGSVFGMNKLIPCTSKLQHVNFKSGLSIREPFYHEENRRTLFKMYGIRFIIVVSGEGKKFDSLQLAMAFGATIALFDLVRCLCIYYVRIIGIYYFISFFIRRPSYVTLYFTSSAI